MERSSQKTLLIIGALFLVGCASTPPPEPRVIVDVQYVYPDCGDPPRRDVIDFRPNPGWQVRDGRFSVDAAGYEDLSFNATETLKGVIQLQGEVEYYEQCLAETGSKESSTSPP